MTHAHARGGGGAGGSDGNADLSSVFILFGLTVYLIWVEILFCDVHLRQKDPVVRSGRCTAVESDGKSHGRTVGRGPGGGTSERF